MLPSRKIKIAALYVKNKKYFHGHHGLVHHFDFYLSNIVFIFINHLELQHIKFTDPNGPLITTTDC
jgi:hypothetical protein